MYNMYKSVQLLSMTSRDIRSEMTCVGFIVKNVKYVDTQNTCFVRDISTIFLQRQCLFVVLQSLYYRVLKSYVQIFSFLTIQICGYGCWMWSLWLTSDFKDQTWFQVRHDLGLKRINIIINKYNICTIHWIENAKKPLFLLQIL